MQELLIFFLRSVGDKSIRGAVYSDDLVDLTIIFGCDVQQDIHDIHDINANTFVVIR